MDYHHKNSKSWQMAHDMGSGSGLYSPILARYFRHVHVSDPSPAGLSTSRKLLSAWSAENKKSRGRFTFSVSKPEQGHDTSADRTVDMVIMMEGAHFTSPEAMVRSAAQSLSKDGTLALVTYSPICRITGNPAANDAVQRLFKAWGTQPWAVVCGDDARGQKQFSLGLDFVPVPDDLFDQSKTRRITINTQYKGSAAFQVPTATAADVSDSKIHNGERRHDYSSENADDQAKGWRQEVGPEFFRSLTAALMGQQATQKFDEHFKEIQKIAHETSPNGLMLTVEWTVAVVLATRR
jgi:SAM-dependent methyltransferase